MRAITSSGINLGQTAEHSPILVQLPNSSARAAATISRARVSRSGCPCGRTPRWAIFAPVNKDAEALGHAATQAPQPMQAAASIEVSAAGFGTGMALPSGALRAGTGMKPARRDNAVECAAVHDQVPHHGKSPRAPGLQVQLVTIAEVAHVKLADG